MTNNFEAVPAAKQTGDAEFFDAVTEYRTLQDQVQELEVELNHLTGKRNKLEFGELLPLGRLDEIKRLSEEVDRKKEQMSVIVDSLISKFYPTNSTIRSALDGVWIGVMPKTAVLITTNPPSLEVRDLM